MKTVNIMFWSMKIGFGMLTGCDGDEIKGKDKEWIEIRS
jgi:hypothetical protein